MDEFLTLLNDLPLPAQHAIHLGVASLIAAAAVLLLYPILRATGRRTNSHSLKLLAERTRGATFWILVCILTLVFWNGLLPEEGSREAAEWPYWAYASHIVVRTGLYFAFAILLIKVVRTGADTLRHYYSIDDVNNLRERKILTQLQYLQKIIIIAIVIIFGALILMQFKTMQRFGTTLLTSAGVGGIIIGLAAQKSIANLLAGFQIAFTQPIRIDDALIVNNEFGFVEEITLTYVTMRLWDQRRQIVPLQYFIDNTFQNWTRSNTELIGTAFFYVDYTFPVAEFRAALATWVEQQPLHDKRVHNALVTDTSERVVTIRVLVSAKNAGETFQLRCATREFGITWIKDHHPECLPQSRVGALASAREGLVPVEDQMIAATPPPQ